MAALRDRIRRGKEILEGRSVGNPRELFHTKPHELLTDVQDLHKWRDYNCDLIRSMFTTEDLAKEYVSSCLPSRAAHDDFDLSLVHLETLGPQISKLESILERLDLYPEIAAPSSARVDSGTVDPSGRSKVFVVHGHDEGAREAVARFVQAIGFEPIILHERANEGRTVIEKVVAHGDVGFAIVLLTPDDEGCVKGGTPGPRARQNVVLELGYFIGRLGRRNVCALKRDDLEMPSDFGGVVYAPLDDRGGWKQALGRELEAAGFEIDWNKVMRS